MTFSLRAGHLNLHLICRVELGRVETVNIPNILSGSSKGLSEWRSVLELGEDTANALNKKQTRGL